MQYASRCNNDAYKSRQIIMAKFTLLYPFVGMTTFTTGFLVLQTISTQVFVYFRVGCHESRFPSGIFGGVSWPTKLSMPTEGKSCLCDSTPSLGRSDLNSVQGLEYSRLHVIQFLIIFLISGRAFTIQNF